MEDKPDIKSVRLEFESGVERETSIRIFVECALDDDEATVWDGDEEVTDIEDIEVEEVEEVEA